MRTHSELKWQRYLSGAAALLSLGGLAAALIAAVGSGS